MLLEEKPHVVFTCESFWDPNLTVSFHQYTVYQEDRKSKRSNGGAVFVHTLILSRLAADQLIT